MRNYLIIILFVNIGQPSPVLRPRISSQSTPEGGRIRDIPRERLRSVVSILAGREITSVEVMVVSTPLKVSRQPPGPPDVRVVAPLDGLR